LAVYNTITTSADTFSAFLAIYNTITT